MIAVIGRQRPQPVRGQELGLVEQLSEQPLDLVGLGDRQQQPLVARLAAQLRPFAQPLHVLDPLTPQEAHEQLVHAHHVLQRRAVDDPGGQRRDHPDHGPDLDRDRGSRREEQPVIEQPVGVIPQALLVQSLPDACEMLEELHDQVL